VPSKILKTKLCPLWGLFGPENTQVFRNFAAGVFRDRLSLLNEFNRCHRKHFSIGQISMKVLKDPVWQQTRNASAEGSERTVRGGH